MIPLLDAADLVDAANHVEARARLLVERCGVDDEDLVNVAGRLADEAFELWGRVLDRARGAVGAAGEEGRGA